ncbi:MAG: hypothetical protein PVSMB9_01490 [Candidatus Dormibacteria bacterium]
MAVVDQRVLLQAVGGEAADRRQGSDRTGGEDRYAHQGKQHDNDQGEQKDAAQVGAATPPPEIDVTPATAAGRYALRNP